MIRPTLKPRNVRATPLEMARGGTRSLTIEMNAGAPRVWNVDIRQPSATRAHRGELARASRPVATIAAPAPASESTTMRCEPNRSASRPAWSMNRANGRLYTNDAMPTAWADPVTWKM